MLERVRARAYGDAVGLERPQVVGGDVLVVEGDDVAAAGEGAQRLEVVVVADDDVVDDLGGRGPGGLAEQPDPDAEPDGGLVQHPGELAAPDDADHRIHGTSLSAAQPAPDDGGRAGR